MQELASLLKEFTPGTYGIWSLVLLGLVYFAREWCETRKLSSEDRLARREGYAKQVEQLMEENRNLRGDLVAMEKLHNDYRVLCHAETDQLRSQVGYRVLCHAETDQLRSQVVSLEDQIAGLMRKLADVAVRAARGDIDANLAASILVLATDRGPAPTRPRDEPITP